MRFRARRFVNAPAVAPNELTYENRVFRVADDGIRTHTPLSRERILSPLLPALLSRVACYQRETPNRVGRKFHGLFYGRAEFCCKTAQCCVTRCKYRIAEIPSVRNAVRRCENKRKRPFLNYECPALTAELQAHLPMKNGVSCRAQKSLIDSMLTFNSPGAPCVSITLPGSS